jgi:hypothetical protein
MDLGDKAAALALSEQAMVANPIEEGRGRWSSSIEIVVRVAARFG